MMLTRIGNFKFATKCLSDQLCKVSGINNVGQIAFITGKALRTDRPPRPPPFPYVEKKYNRFYQFFDPMMTRFDDNTKLIVVEGPIAAGKGKFAAKLAEELEMQYMAPLTFDDIYINEYGFDHRSLNSVLPKSCQAFDTEMFLKNPRDINATSFQFFCYLLKLDRYMNALLHILSTGQGVVLNRCVYSDYVFMKSMYRHGYVTKPSYNMYLDQQDDTLIHVIRPHLIIYLDIPVNEVKKRIQQRNIPYEVNSEILTDKYLAEIEHLYKEEYLKKMETHSHVLVYDWTKEGDAEAVVEEIQELDFDSYTRRDKKMRDWLFATVDDIRQLRVKCAERDVLNMFMRELYDIPEMIIPAGDLKAATEIYEEKAKFYDAGFNPHHGDNILWKWRAPNVLNTFYSTEKNK